MSQRCSTWLQIGPRLTPNHLFPVRVAFGNHSPQKSGPKRPRSLPVVAHAVLLPNRLLNNLDFLVSQPVQLIHDLNPTFFIVGWFASLTTIPRKIWTKKALAYARVQLLPNRRLDNFNLLVSQPVQLIHDINPTFFIVGCLRHLSSKNLDQKGRVRSLWSLTRYYSPTASSTISISSSVSPYNSYTISSINASVFSIFASNSSARSFVCT